MRRTACSWTIKDAALTHLLEVAKEVDMSSGKWETGCIWLCSGSDCVSKLVFFAPSPLALPFCTCTLAKKIDACLGILYTASSISIYYEVVEISVPNYIPAQAHTASIMRPSSFSSF
jgi:hypothetical protein